MTAEPAQMTSAKDDSQNLELAVAFDKAICRNLRRVLFARFGRYHSENSDVSLRN
jgi:hypothetical protein